MNEEKKTQVKKNTVKIKLPRTKDNKAVFVGLNGKNYLIPRGKEVEVPKGVAEILDMQERYQEERYKAEEERMKKNSN